MPATPGIQSNIDVESSFPVIEYSSVIQAYSCAGKTSIKLEGDVLSDDITIDGKVCNFEHLVEFINRIKNIKSAAK